MVTTCDRPNISWQTWHAILGYTTVENFPNLNELECFVVAIVNQIIASELQVNLVSTTIYYALPLKTHPLLKRFIGRPRHRFVVVSQQLLQRHCHL